MNKIYSEKKEMVILTLDCATKVTIELKTNSNVYFAFTSKQGISIIETIWNGNFHKLKQCIEAGVNNAFRTCEKQSLDLGFTRNTKTNKSTISTPQQCSPLLELTELTEIYFALESLEKSVENAA